LWPAHEWDGWQSPKPLKTLYVGAAGVVHALEVLRRRSLAETSLDLVAVGRRALEAWREKPGVLTTIPFPEPRNPALFMGETGIALVLYRLGPNPTLGEELLQLVEENLANPLNEMMWGPPGALIAARAMQEWTGEERWSDAARESEAVARGMPAPDDLTPFHGLIGNALVLGDDIGEVLRVFAIVQDGLVNWPSPDLPEPKLQWCDGAPGVVTCAASYLDEDLLLGGAELTWLAGPLGEEKGAGLCHGTAGNGWAFLKAFERTQDELWLVRARRFAVHALEQARAGQRRYSLWTGDPGVALYAADCLEARTRYPVLETWD
jgi:Lanthionine synthetase C-like protein